MTDNDPRWPCHKRVAHGPHPVEIEVAPDQYETDLCDGLKAHWDTMIGREPGNGQEVKEA